jgi:hypothetical protein
MRNRYEQRTTHFPTAQSEIGRPADRTFERIPKPESISVIAADPYLDRSSLLPAESWIHCSHY